MNDAAETARNEDFCSTCNTEKTWLNAWACECDKAAAEQARVERVSRIRGPRRSMGCIELNQQAMRLASS